MIEGTSAGRCLVVDLTEGVARSEDLRDRLGDGVPRRFVGGAGLAAKILVEEGAPGNLDPLGPESAIVFATGPLTGVSPPSGRHVVAAKSPQTGIWGEASVGGTWGNALRKAGFDLILVRGRSRGPVYVWVHDGRAEIRDGSGLWGLDTYTTDAALKKELPAGAVTSCIGPGGERLVGMAGIFTDGTDGRAAARCGLGAAMGAKNLKAIAVNGTRTIPVADPELSRSVSRRIAANACERAETLGLYGTARGVVGAESIGDLPIMNWRIGSWPEGARKLSGQALADTVLTGRSYCSRCTIGCGRRVRLENSPHGSVDGAGPEYETLAALGSMCLVDDLEAVVVANDMCNRYGVDTISVGAAVAFTMEAYERGLVTRADLDGVEAAWGNAAAMLSLVRKIALGEGFGRVLGRGVRHAANCLGVSAKDFAIESKGLEFPMHDPRAFHSLALGYATSNRGACHLQGVTHALESSKSLPEMGFDRPLDRFGHEGKGKMVAIMQDVMALFNATPACILFYWCGMTLTDLVDAVNAATGWDMTVQEIRAAGERIFTLKRLYNNACGITSDHDSVPHRIVEMAHATGGAAESLPEFPRMLADYYKHRDWDAGGVPRPEKVNQLDLAGEAWRLLGGGGLQ